MPQLFPNTVPRGKGGNRARRVLRTYKALTEEAKMQKKCCIWKAVSAEESVSINYGNNINLQYYALTGAATGYLYLQIGF